MSKTVVFFGNERLATGVSTSAPTLRALLDNGYRVAAVVTNQDIALSRKQRQLEVSEIAAAHNIPLLSPSSSQELLEQLTPLTADAGVLVAYGRIVPQKVIDLFPSGIINIHPSALPKHRGSTPIESTILAGETETAISYMQLVKAMDAGPVFGTTPVKLSGNEGKQELADTLAELGSQGLLKLLPNILSGQLTATPQQGEPTYDQRIHKEDGRIDWQKPAEQLAREVRAYSIWPGSFTTLAGKEVTITEAHAITAKSGEPGSAQADKTTLAVACGNGSLVVDRIKPSGKADMPIQAFLAGHLDRLT